MLSGIYVTCLLNRKNMAEKIFRTLSTIEFLVEVLFEGFGNPFKKIRVNNNKLLLILANGPSLKNKLSEIKDNIETYINYEYSVINDFVHNDLFSILKPLHYTLSDPMFFRDTPQKERGLSVMKALSEKVNWDMYLYINNEFKNSEYLNIIKNNPHIHIICYHHPKYQGVAKCRNYIFSKGLANGEYSTVVSNSIYIAITEGYKNIQLYGVDHTFFEGLTVNDQNIPCYIYKHSFDDSAELKPIRFTYNYSREYMDMTMFLYEKYDVFRGHKYLASYAKYMGANVINCTPNSLIDTYIRQKYNNESI